MQSVLAADAQYAAVKLRVRERQDAYSQAVARRIEAMESLMDMAALQDPQDMRAARDRQQRMEPIAATLATTAAVLPDQVVQEVDTLVRLHRASAVIARAARMRNDLERIGGREGAFEQIRNVEYLMTQLAQDALSGMPTVEHLSASVERYLDATEGGNPPPKR